MKVIRIEILRTEKFGEAQEHVGKNGGSRWSPDQQPG
jgi:hypothetical protein